MSIKQLTQTKRSARIYLKHLPKQSTKPTTTRVYHRTVLSDYF